jgi:hypothetical protein
MHSEKLRNEAKFFEPTDAVGLPAEAQAARAKAQPTTATGRRWVGISATGCTRAWITLS